MSERIHRVLDGEAPREGLSPAERARLEALEHILRASAGALRDAPAPDLAPRVMAALPAGAPRRAGALRRALAWLWAPRPVRLALRPAYALGPALAAALALALLPPSRAATEAAPAAPPVYVQFRLEADGARQVRLAGTFTDWRPTVALRETAPGEWTALVPLRPGVHDYAFVIDGRRWVADPHAPQVDDDFGGTNSRIALPALAGRT